MEERPRSKISDREYIKNLGTKQLPPLSADTKMILDKLVFEPCLSAEAKLGIAEVAAEWPWKDSIGEVRTSDFVFLSLQSLIPLYQELGYDIRPILEDHGHDLLLEVRYLLQRRTTEPSPPLSGGLAGIDGQEGLILDRNWLRSAGVAVEISGKGWARE